MEAARRIDRICERFESALQAGQPATVESFLAEIPTGGPESSELLRELLALELEYRVRRGEHPSSGEYLPRFPGQERIVEFVIEESARRRAEVAPPLPADHPRYRLVRLLGSGGMGSVYLAEHRILRRPVALKVINPELLSDPSALERFRSEARAAACLSHPNVVTVYDAETAGDGHFLVMEYVAGTDLARLVAKSGPLPVAAACDYIAQAALGLEHAHRHGMVHRDITPRNLMLSDDGAVKVLDFGLAYFVSEAKTGDRPATQNVLLGSIDYMAPEQAADPHTADIRADVYSLGCTLYFLLAGQPPFPHGELAEKITIACPAVAARLGRSPRRCASGAAAGVGADACQVARRSLSNAGRGCSRFDALVRPGCCDDIGCRRERAIAARSSASLGLGGCRLFDLRTGAMELGSRVDAVRRRHGRRRSCAAGGPAALPRGRSTAGSTPAAANTSGDPASAKRNRACTDFALAYATLADAYNLCGDYGWMKADEAYPKAKEAALAAVARNPKLAEAHSGVGFRIGLLRRRQSPGGKGIP